MEKISQYLLSVTAAAILCGIALCLTGRKSTHGTIIRMICGLILAITVIFPWTDIQITDLTAYADDFMYHTETAVTNGQGMANEAVNSIIKSNIEAYILDKAASLNANIDVNVILSDAEPSVPEFVTIQGEVSPYAKARLQQCITNELGIPKEKQSWS